MKPNVGSYDAAVRFVLGCAVMYWGVSARNWWGLVGVVPLLTGVCGYCLLYLPFGIDTTGCDHRQAK
ncbi:MAG: DUF2892 domain-containing protein [Opitutus sp.]|jgi:hypothetical protein|nr:DUF2892 domain-containing protein [Opitutus sp.]